MRSAIYADALTPSGLEQNSAILITNGKIESVLPAGRFVPDIDAQIFDWRGCVASPGWIDIQLNGGFGLDFTDIPDTIWDVAAQLPRFGTTAFLPTIITSPLEVPEYAIEVLRRGPPPGWKGALPLGLHFEGPFLNPAKKGAHNPDHLRQPDPALVVNWSADNNVRLVTLAPELPGADATIRQLQAQGVTVSAGHSIATYEQAKAAFDSGVTSVTHLYNAMPALEHRAPGLTGATLSDPRVVTGLIVDGIHCHPSMVTLAWNMKGPEGIALVTDAMGALGMPPGQYRIGDLDAVVDGISARLPNGTLAGSILSQDQALRNLMAFTGCSLESALPALSTTQARLVRLGDYGQIKPGLEANLTIVDPAGNVKATIIRGEVF